MEKFDLFRCHFGLYYYSTCRFWPSSTQASVDVVTFGARFRMTFVSIVAHIIISIIFASSRMSTQEIKSNNAYVVELFKALPYRVDQNLVFSPIGIKWCMLICELGGMKKDQSMDEHSMALPEIDPNSKRSAVIQKLSTMLNHLPTMSDKFEAMNHNYWQTFLFYPDNKATNRTALNALERLFALLSIPLKSNGSETEKQKYSKIFKEKLPTFRGTPPPFAEQPQLLNIIVFLRNWKRIFTRLSSPMTFHAASGATRPVPQMQTIVTGASIAYSARLGSMLIDIPYQDSPYSMVIIMPNRTATLASLIEQIGLRNLDSAIARLHTDASMRKNVRLTMPPFRVEQEHELSKILARVYPEFAAPNLARISGEMINLQTKQVALIEVSEQGTFAQAITRMQTRMMLFTNTELVIDRPFLYMVVAKPTDHSKEATKKERNKSNQYSSDEEDSSSSSSSASSNYLFEIFFAGYVNDPLI